MIIMTTNKSNNFKYFVHTLHRQAARKGLDAQPQNQRSRHEVTCPNFVRPVHINVVGESTINTVADQST